MDVWNWSIEKGIHDFHVYPFTQENITYEDHSRYRHISLSHGNCYSFWNDLKGEDLVSELMGLLLRYPSKCYKKPLLELGKIKQLESIRLTVYSHYGYSDNYSYREWKLIEYGH